MNRQNRITSSEENRPAVLGSFEGECADSNITNLNGLDITREVWENDSCIEIWRSIPGYESYYEASNLGNIRRINSKGSMQLKPWIGLGYKVVGLYVNNKRKDEFVHRLVVKTFLPNPKNNPQVNHKDGNKLNNCLYNLEWVTQSENAKHAYLNGLIIVDKEKKKACAKLGTDKVKVKILCKELNMIFDSISSAARHFNLDISKIAYASLNDKQVNGLTFIRIGDA